MKVVYIAGPYRGRTEWEVKENILRAEKVAAEFWRRGYAVICPHKNSSWMGGLIEDSQWIAAGRELVKRSDIIVLLPGWKSSEGAREELREARLQGKEIIFYHEDSSH